MRAERLRHIAGDDLETSIALTRENLRMGVSPLSGVPWAHEFAAFDANFDVWPEAIAGAMLGRRAKLCVLSRCVDDAPALGKLLLNGELVGTRRRLAVALCNLWRRLPAPHPMEGGDEVTITRGAHGTLQPPWYTPIPAPGHALRGYIEALHVALGLSSSAYRRRLIVWMAEHGEGWRIPLGDLQLTGEVARVSCGTAHVWVDCEITATADFDASCLPIVPMSIAGGDDEQG